MLKRKEVCNNLSSLVVGVDVLDVIHHGQLIVAVELVDVFHELICLATEATCFLTLTRTCKQRGFIQ